MDSIWIIIEMSALFIDSITAVFFLSRRYSSKYETKAPDFIMSILIFLWGTVVFFANIHFLMFDLMEFIFMLIYLFLTKRGTAAQKIFGIIFIHAILLSVALSGASFAALITSESIENTVIYQDNARVLSIIVIKSAQIVVIYLLSRKHYDIRLVKKKPLLVLVIAVVLDLSCLMLMLFNLSHFDERTNKVVIGIAGSMLLILLGIFLMNEMFIKEEERNIDLSSRLQRLEIETQFYEQLKAMYSDLRTWRHEYKNNLISLEKLVAKNPSSKEALDYLDKIRVKADTQDVMMQSGNTVLDAVVSAKLILAKSYKIKTDIHTVYPRECHVADNDLCAVAGNLLDNAIEACERMKETDRQRFVSFSLLVKGRNLTISISNSFDGKIEKQGERYITAKNHPFHGLGLGYVDSIVHRYHGHIIREQNDGIFETNILIPLILKGEDRDDKIN